MPDCLIEGKFKGTVSLSPGSWKVGLVQNLSVKQYDQNYDHGGTVSEFDPGPLIDLNVDDNDIFFGDAKADFSISSPMAVSVDIDGLDTPFSDPALGQRTRAGGQISENLKSMVNLLRFRMALVARRKGDGQPDAIIVLASTDKEYGVTWVMTVSPSGQADFDSQTFGANMKPGIGAGIVLDGPSAASFSQRRHRTALDRYEADTHGK